MRGFDTHRWIARNVGQRLWLVAALCLLQGVLAVNGVVYALLMRNTVDAAVTGVSGEFWMALAAFAGVILLQVLLNAANRYAAERVRISVENGLRARTFADILGQDARAFARRHSGDLMTRLTSDTTAVTAGVASFVPTVVSMGVRVLAVLAAMLTLAPQLAMAFLVLGAAMGAASMGLRGVMKRLHKRQQEAEGSMRSYLQECLESLLVIRAFGVGGKVQEANRRNMDEHKRARLARANASNAGNTGLSLAVQGGYILGFAWCGWGILQGTVSYGTLMAVIQLISQIQSPFASMGGVFSQYSAMLASAERLMELDAGAHEHDSLTRTPEKGPASANADDCEAARLYGRMRSIRFESVSFGYDADHVLENFSAEIPKGTFTTMVGSSGIGKSTLMKLLLGVYEPDGGRVLLQTEGPVSNDVAAPAFAEPGPARVLADVPASRAPSGLFAYVPQGNHLMSGTIREAVSFADSGDNADEERVREACRAACALDFVEELPQGLDTALGEHGAGLSEGQLQRLAVARAVYSQAPVLLLDEATSALDEDTEREMMARLKALPGRTVIAITHRPEALALSDLVIRLDAQSCVTPTPDAPALASAFPERRPAS